MTEAQKKRCGRRIGIYLLDHRKSRKWLSDQCGVSRSMISYIILGDKAPSRALAERIASVLGMSVEALIK
jgi:transcriptional regulator with XRE-family HTH domain